MSKIAKRDNDRQKLWEERITLAKAVRENWKKQFKVDLARDYFEGKQNPGYPEKEWITINKVYSHLKATLPSLYAADPYFYVKLRRSFSPNPMDIALWEQRGKIRAAMLNYLKEELQLKVKARLCIQDAHFAYGVLKAAYQAETLKNERYGQTIKGESGEDLVDEQSGEPLREPEYVPVNERYAITRLHPDDFMWDADAGPLEDSWHFLFEQVKTTFGKLRANPEFDQRAVRSLAGKGTAELDDEARAREERKKGGDIKAKGETSSFKDRREMDDDEPVSYWLCWDLEKKTYSAVAIGAEMPLLDSAPSPKGTELHPYSVLIFTPRDDSPYPIPPVSQGIDPCKELNLARSRILIHRKRFNRKYLAMGQFDDGELDKLEVGEDGTVVRAGMTGAQLTPIQDAPLDQQGYLEIGYLNTDINEMLGGTTDEARGIAGADSATQAGILDKRLEVREGDAMSMVIDFILANARKTDQLVQSHIDRDEAVLVAGPQGEYWQMVRVTDYEQINGEFAYSVNVGATIPRMPQMERSSWQGFLALLQSFPQLLLSKRLLKVMAEQHHIEDEAMIDELYQLGQKMMSGGLPTPGAAGSQPNVTEQRPGTATGGQAGGPMSLMLPGAGNFQG